MFWVIPSSWQSSFMNFDMNWGSQLLMILDGSSNLGKICLRNSSTTPLALMVSLQGIAISIFVQLWSVIVKIKLNPSVLGSFTIKSMAIVWNRSVLWCSVISTRGAFFGWVLILFLWHSLGHSDWAEATNSILIPALLFDLSQGGGHMWVDHDKLGWSCISPCCLLSPLCTSLSTILCFLSWDHVYQPIDVSLHLAVGVLQCRILFLDGWRVVLVEPLCLDCHFLLDRSLVTWITYWLFHSPSLVYVWVWSCILIGLPLLKLFFNWSFGVPSNIGGWHDLCGQLPCGGIPLRRVSSVARLIL